MRQYHTLLKEILSNGDVMYEPRTEEHTIGLGGWQSIYDLREGFPLVTTKHVSSRLVFEELFWKMRGEHSVKPLFDRDVHIWDANAFDHYLKTNNLKNKFPKHTPEWEEEFEKFKDDIRDGIDPHNKGELGPVYGYQWRRGFRVKPEIGEVIDQLDNVIKSIKEKPGSRYHIISAWNPSDLPSSAIGPCPMIHQFSVFGKNLDLNTYQRSCDVFLGVPFNIAQESMFNHMMAQETGLIARKFIHSYGNVHSYLGVPPRSDFWNYEKNVKEFQGRFKEIGNNQDYLNLREWYLNRVSPESSGNERKDHIPFILEQLSKDMRELPKIEMKGVPLYDAINMSPKEVAQIKNYNPHKWDSQAVMAA